MKKILQYNDPRTGLLLDQQTITSSKELISQTSQATLCLQEWASTSFNERADVIDNIVCLLCSRKQILAELEAKGTGKSLSVAQAEIEDGISLWKYAASLARTRTEISKWTSNLACYHVLQTPVGVVALIVPWNYPFITVSERLPFAIAAGCTVILKPSELAAGCLSDVVNTIQSSSKVPKNLVQICYGSGAEICPMLAEIPEIAMFAYVGSTSSGRKLQTLAASRGKLFSGEMGGNNFMFVYEDADLKLAAESAITNGLRNAGQACIASTHLLVEPQVENEFKSHLVSALNNYLSTTGSELQPLISTEKAIAIEQTIKKAFCCGVEPINQLSEPFREGRYIPPMLLKLTGPNDEMLKSELFAPILTLTEIQKDKFLPISHQSGYGLALYLWTNNHRLAAETIFNARFGRIWLNAKRCEWDPNLPVGGFGLSGSGRELGHDALNRYSQTKSVIINW